MRMRKTPAVTPTFLGGAPQAKQPSSAYVNMGKKKKGGKEKGDKGGGGEKKLPPPPNLDDRRQGAHEALLTFKSVLHTKL